MLTRSLLQYCRPGPVISTVIAAQVEPGLNLENRPDEAFEEFQRSGKYPVIVFDLDWLGSSVVLHVLSLSALRCCFLLLARHMAALFDRCSSEVGMEKATRCPRAGRGLSQYNCERSDESQRMLIGLNEIARSRAKTP